MSKQITAQEHAKDCHICNGTHTPYCSAHQPTPARQEALTCIVCDVADADVTRRATGMTIRVPERGPLTDAGLHYGPPQHDSPRHCMRALKRELSTLRQRAERAEGVVAAIKALPTRHCCTADGASVRNGACVRHRDVRDALREGAL